MRIGVNVPNELLRQVKEITPKVNVSEVCREALRRHVEVSQRAVQQAAADNVVEQVMRLDESTVTPMIEPDWVGLALDDARAWVSAVTPEIWEKMIAQSDFLRKKGRDDIEMADLWSQEDGAKGFWTSYHDNRDWFLNQHEIMLETSESFNPLELAKQKYCRTWLAYVYEVRRLLEKHRKEEYNRIMAERAVAQESRPAPELPRQLL